MDSFAFWLHKPFDPRPVSKPTRRRTRFVTIRYTGSFGRSAVKALIVFMLLAIMANIVGERTGRGPDANELGRTAGAAAR